MTRSTFALALASMFVCGAARAQTSADGLLDAASREALSTTIRDILVECVPEKIAGEDDWGETKQAFSGLTWRLDGLKLDVERRMKPVKHGLWKKWELTPVEPAKHLRFRIDAARSTGPAQFAFRITTSSPLLAHAQFERWRTGVKMLNAQLDADAYVEMTLDGDVQYRFDESDGGSYAVITPQIKAVDLKLLDLRWRKIGVFDGNVMREAADAFDPMLVKQIDAQEPKAVEKLNAALVKRQDKLKIPFPAPLDFSRWEIIADQLLEVTK